MVPYEYGETFRKICCLLMAAKNKSNNDVMKTIITIPLYLLLPIYFKTPPTYTEDRSFLKSEYSDAVLGFAAPSTFCLLKTYHRI